MRLKHQIILAVALLLLAAPAAARDFTQGTLHIGNPWSRATPGGATVAAGYLAVENKGSSADRLISAAAEISGRAEIHEMKMEGGVMKMRPLANGIEIAPGTSLKLEPGGYHIMFIGLKRPLAKGQRFKGELVFEKAGKIELEFVVEAIGTGAPRHGR